MTPNGSPEHEDNAPQNDLGKPMNYRQSEAGEAPSRPPPDPDSPEGLEHPRRPGRLKHKMLLLNRFIDHSVKGLDGQTALLWVVLFRHEQNGEAMISVKRLADIMGVSRRTVARHLRTLVQNEMLRKKKTGVKNVHANVYQIGRKHLAKDNPLKRPQSGRTKSQPEGPDFKHGGS
jgi:DNA-binding MarR family transcriptional regulator